MIKPLMYQGQLLQDGDTFYCDQGRLLVKDAVAGATCQLCIRGNHDDTCLNKGLPDCTDHFFTHVPRKADQPKVTASETIVKTPGTMGTPETFASIKTIAGVGKTAYIPTKPDSGLNGNYYEVKIKFPTKEDKEPYLAECNDITEALEMTPHEYNIFKSIWRKAAARLGTGKAGGKALYDAEKCLFAARRLVVLETRKANTTAT